jgi:hypothetical protein
MLAMMDNDKEQEIKALDEEVRFTVFRSIMEQVLIFLDKKREEKRRREQRRKLTKIIILGAIVFLIYNLPLLLGTRMNCEEYQTAPFYQKMHYHIHPLIVNPCDSTSPFLTR